MMTQVSRICSGCAFFALVAWGSLPCMVSCSSSDDTPAGGRLAHPPQPPPRPVTSVARAQDAGLLPPEGSFAPLDQAIADDCGPPPRFIMGLPQVPQPRAWSQNVPNRDCTNDGECGDGFCDRGHCAAIWTCNERYGQRCINGRAVPGHEIQWDLCNGVCLEGRCRSCESDAECVQARGFPEARCMPSQQMSHGRVCLRIVEPLNRPIP